MEKSRTTQSQPEHRWQLVAERDGFKLYHRPRDSSVLVDNFTIVRSNDKWRIGYADGEIKNNADDEILRTQFPKLRMWALEHIEKFSQRHFEYWQTANRDDVP